MTFKCRVLFALGLVVTPSRIKAQLEIDRSRYPEVPEYGPQPNPEYMVDNTKNYFKVAPDKGKQNGPVWDCSGAFEGFIRGLHQGQIARCDSELYTNVTIDKSLILPSASNRTTNGTSLPTIVPSKKKNMQLDAKQMLTNETVFSKQVVSTSESRFAAQAGTSYWLTALAPLGMQPHAPSGYKFYRDVVRDYKADNTGATDASEAINAAIADGNRCGEKCSNTFILGAIIYFPPGTYKICTPIIQLYYTQFIGDALQPPTLKGCSTFKGIAMIDTDPYIPGGNGANWFKNQNQFFRHIRNFVFDLSEMPLKTNEHDQELVPTGIHWQVSQACTLQNLVFNMPQATTSNKATHVGIFMENGSGGFVSDLTFNGGASGWRAGSQQYTARNLKFKNCQQAVQMIWDWGFNWQQVEISGGVIAFNISGKGGITSQGIGSTSIMDTTISNVPIGVLTHDSSDAPSIVLDNVILNNVADAVRTASGKTLLAGGTTTIDLWATGRRYNGSTGSYQTGPVQVPKKPTNLLDSGRLFARSRPQYEALSPANFLIATQNGCDNSGKGDQTGAINAFLQKAAAQGLVAYFPAGIYQVGGTVFVPTGSRLQGSSWSQIQGGGAYFADFRSPQVMVRVGNKGEVGNVEIVEMMFTVRGPTAGAVMMEWNIAAAAQGSAGMWDTHFRVGGGFGTDLDAKTCPKFGFREECIAASLMLHVTKQASGYFENVWTWVADHDNDMDTHNEPDDSVNQISIYVGRGMLIESQGPSWFVGTGSEHCVLYQYQVHDAKSVYLGHIQTESPYYQPKPVAPQPFGSVAKSFAADPDFSSCSSESCKYAWGLRIINSKDVIIHGAGLYSFFNEYYQDCVETQDCQEHILEVKGSSGVVIFNLFTIATQMIASGVSNSHVLQRDNQSGFTTEVSVWIPLPGDDHFDIVYVGTEVWSQPTARCSPPCILVLPPSTIAAETTINPGKYTTSFEYGHTATVTIGGQVVTTFVTSTTTVTIDVPIVVVSSGGVIPFSNINITQSGSSTTTVSAFVANPSVPIPPIVVTLPDGNGASTTRTANLPPWPQITRGPPRPSTLTYGQDPSTSHIGVTQSITAPSAGVITATFPACLTGFTGTTTKSVTFFGPSVAIVVQDCTKVILPPARPPPTTTTTTTTTSITKPLPVWTTWPPGSIIPVTETVDQPKPTDGGGWVTPCKLWFFFWCLDINGPEPPLRGWKWILPPGIYPPGPPPWFSLPTPWNVKGILPPWPKITVGPSGEVSYEPEEPGCTKKTAEACTTKTVYSETVDGTTTKTTATQTTTRCETITGCAVRDTNTQTSTSTQTACTPTPTTPENSDNGCAANAAIYPRDQKNLGDILQILGDLEYEKIETKATGAVTFIYVTMLDRPTLAKLKNSPFVSLAYYYEAYYAAHPVIRDEDMKDSLPDEDLRRDVETDHPRWRASSSNTTSSQLEKRIPTSLPAARHWALSQVSSAKGKRWGDRESYSVTEPGPNGATQYLYHYDNYPAGLGQTVYILGEDVVWRFNPEFSGATANGRIFTMPDRIYDYETPDNHGRHGTAVAAKILGPQVGVCHQCSIVLMGAPATKAGLVDTRKLRKPEDWLTGLTLVEDHILEEKENRAGNAVITWSSGDALVSHEEPFFQALRQKMADLEALGVPIVTSAGNDGEEIALWPALFADPSQTDIDIGGPALTNMIVVGASTKEGIRSDRSDFADFLTTYAPGKEIHVPSLPKGGFTRQSGTSLAAPQVAALIAYWRAMPSRWQRQITEGSPAAVARVKKLVTAFHRPFSVKIDGVNRDIDERNVQIIWNGQVGDRNCLMEGHWDEEWSQECPKLKDNLDEQPDGRGADSCALGLRRRQLDGSCPLPDNKNAKTITFSSSSIPSPTCRATGCGTLCTGYYCSPHPTGPPPGFQDPKDPNNDREWPTTTITGTTLPPGGSSTKSQDTPSSTSKQPPKATPSLGRVVFALQEQATPSENGPWDWSRAWKVFGVGGLQGTYDICSISSVFSKATNTDTSLDAKFPPDLGPFTVHGLSCQYEGSRDKLGTMRCDGAKVVECFEAPEVETTQCSIISHIDLYQTVICRI